MKAHLFTKFAAFVYTILAVYFYVVMEWIFFVTQISFMSAMAFLDQAKVPLVVSLVFLVPLLFLISLLLLLSLLVPIRLVNIVLERVIVLIPVLIFAFLALIMTDNFTYTIFGFGIVSTEGWERSIYTIVVFLYVATFYKALWGRSLFKKINSQQTSRATTYFALLLLGTSLLFSALESNRAELDFDPKSIIQWNKVDCKLPNVLLLSTDGLNSSHMSAYGYQRETTPSIEQYAQSALVSQNAFANAGATGGSIISLLTGKSTLTTRMYYPPDILTGTHSFQHLPGLLKQLGYKTIQSTDPYHADAYTRNLLSGFDVANSRSEARSIPSQIAITISKYIGDGSSTYFTTVIVERILDRLLHSFYIKSMVNPYKFVTEPAVRLDEQERIRRMLVLFRESKEPVFAQIHLLGTHGPRFNPSDRKFSDGQTQESEWMIDFYDDSILSFDHDVDQIFKSLDQIGELDNTVIVLFSDHGMNWKSEERIPLIFWFPGGEYKGMVHQNVQLLDIAPTLIDYLNLPQPAWLEGKSLLKNIPQRYIFSTNPADSVKVKMKNGLYEGRMIAPFYQLGIVTMIACDRWYTLNLKDPELITGTIFGSTLLCDESSLPSAEDALFLILEQLDEAQYDISTFPKQIF
jgi:hypothetical protein